MKSITEMSKDEINQELCERLGNCYHANYYEWRDCDKIHARDWRIDFFSDAGKVGLLGEMMKRENWRGFYIWVSDHSRIMDYNSSGRVFIALSCLFDTTGLLARIALEWLRREQDGTG